TCCGPLWMWTPFSAATCARTPATVGAALFRTTTRTMLFLSRNASRDAPPLWAHPSGYFIEYPAAELRKTRKTWLSGMSPVAAALASACSAFAEAVVAGFVVAACVVVGGAAVFVPPQPAAARATSRGSAFTGIPDMLRTAA